MDRGPRVKASIIITRPKAAADRLAIRLAEPVGPACEIVCSPVIEIMAVPATVGKIAYHGVIFTSVHGVLHAPDMTAKKTCWCVGEMTARAAGEAGYAVKHHAMDAETLLADLAGMQVEGPLLHLRGTYTRVDLAQRLADAGIPCDDLVVYKQDARSLSTQARATLEGETPVILPLYSPRSAALVADQGPFAAPITVVAISDATAHAAAGLAPENVVVAGRPDGVAMIAAIVAVAGTVCPK